MNTDTMLESTRSRAEQQQTKNHPCPSIIVFERFFMLSLLINREINAFNPEDLRCRFLLRCRVDPIQLNGVYM